MPDTTTLPARWGNGQRRESSLRVALVEDGDQGGGRRRPRRASIAGSSSRWGERAWPTGKQYPDETLMEWSRRLDSYENGPKGDA